MKQWGHWPALASLIAVGRSNIAFLLPSVRESMFEFVWDHVDQLSAPWGWRFVDFFNWTLKHLSKPPNLCSRFVENVMDKCWLGMWHAPVSCSELGSSSVCQSWRVSFHSHLCRTFLIHSRYIIGLQTLTPNGQIFMCLCWDIRILDDIRWNSMFVHPCTSLKLQILQSSIVQGNNPVIFSSMNLLHFVESGTQTQSSYFNWSSWSDT